MNDNKSLSTYEMELQISYYCIRTEISAPSDFR